MNFDNKAIGYPKIFQNPEIRIKCCNIVRFPKCTIPMTKTICYQFITCMLNRQVRQLVKISIYLKTMHSNMDIMLKDAEFLIRMYIDNLHMNRFESLHHYQLLGIGRSYIIS